MDRTYDQRPLSDESWRLSESDRALVYAKPKRARLEFAVLLLFFRAHGRFPRAGADIAPALVARVARQLGLVSPVAVRRPIPLRTLKRYLLWLALIRAPACTHRPVWAQAR
jgi:Domain of unknown function (DUF4158)